MQGSMVIAGGAIVFAILWFVAKAIIGHIIAHWLLIKAKKRGFGRKDARKKP